MMKILIPTDFTEKTKAAVTYALNIFKDTEVTYTLVNTYQEPQAASGMLISIKDILLKDSEQGLEADMAWIDLKFPGHRKQFSSRAFYGPFRSSIDSLAKQLEIDLVVMGTEPKQNWHHKFLNNHRGLVSNNHYPVLIVPNRNNHLNRLSALLATDLQPCTEIGKKRISWLSTILKPVVNTLFITTVKNTNVPLTDKELDVRNEFLELTSDLSPVFNTLVDTSISQAINQFIDDRQVDLLVMTARKHKLLDRLMNDSNTKEMALQSALPLLILPEV
jgi:nucleotide-binding universal stress UspA family protein